MRPFARSTEGQSMVELAILLPLLLLTLVGIVDVALLLNAGMTVTNASREAASYAIAHPTALPSAIASAASSKSAPLLADQLTVNTTYYNSASATFVAWPTDGTLPSHSPAVAVPVSVEVSYPWSSVTIFLGQLFGTSTRSVTSRSTMVVTW